MVSALARRAGLERAAVEVRDVSAEAGGLRVSLEPPGDPLSPASMIKVPIAAALAERWDAGELLPSSPLVVREEDLTANDLPSPLVAGYPATLEELGRLMLTRSDNVATNALIRLLGRERINERSRSWGLPRTAVRRKLSGSLPLVADPEASGRNAHPASDAAALFEQIALEQRAAGAWLRDTLFAQEWNDKLSGGLEPGDRFAHKTGETSEVSHDGGILELPGGARFVIVVYTALPGSAGGERFAAFMRGLRPFLA